MANTADEDSELSADEQRKLDEMKNRNTHAKRAAVQEARDRQAPRIGSPVLVGLASRYWRSDVETFGDQHEAPIAECDSAMRAIGFEKLGDLLCKRFRDFAMHCYVHPQNLGYATLTLTKESVYSIDFVTKFADGSLLTTTTSMMVENRPKVGLYYKSYPALGTRDLYEQHQELIQRFCERKQVVVSVVEPTLLGFATSMDEALQKVDEDDRIGLEETRDIWRF